MRGSTFIKLLKYNPVVLSTAIITREALNKVGVFNPKYEIAEEYDLWLKIGEYYPIDFIEQPLAKYRIHSEGIYRKNTILAYQEDLWIRDYWLKRNPGLKEYWAVESSLLNIVK